jgi:hypothetical protein
MHVSEPEPNSGHVGMNFGLSNRRPVAPRAVSFISRSIASVRSPESQTAACSSTTCARSSGTSVQLWLNFLLYESDRAEIGSAIDSVKNTVRRPFAASRSQVLLPSLQRVGLGKSGAVFPGSGMPMGSASAKSRGALRYGGCMIENARSRYPSRLKYSSESPRPMA